VLLTITIAVMTSVKVGSWKSNFQLCTYTNFSQRCSMPKQQKSDDQTSV